MKVLWAPLTGDAKRSAERKTRRRDKGVATREARAWIAALDTATRERYREGAAPSARVGADGEVALERAEREGTAGHPEHAWDAPQGGERHARALLERASVAMALEQVDAMGALEKTRIACTTLVSPATGEVEHTIAWRLRTRAGEAQGGTGHEGQRVALDPEETHDCVALGGDADGPYLEMTSVEDALRRAAENDTGAPGTHTTVAWRKGVEGVWAQRTERRRVDDGAIGARTLEAAFGHDAVERALERALWMRASAREMRQSTPPRHLARDERWRDIWSTRRRKAPRSAWALGTGEYVAEVQLATARGTACTVGLFAERAGAPHIAVIRAH